MDRNRLKDLPEAWYNSLPCDKDTLALCSSSKVMRERCKTENVYDMGPPAAGRCAPQFVVNRIFGRDAMEMDENDFYEESQDLVRTENADAVRVWLKHPRVEPYDVWLALNIAVKRNDEAIARLILSDPRVFSKESNPVNFSNAIKNSNISMLRLLLDNLKDIRPDYSSYSSLFDLENLTLMKQMYGMLLPIEDKTFPDVLYSACSHGQLWAIELLLEDERSNNVNIERFKNPIHAAIEGSHADVLNLLLSDGRFANAININEQLPISIENGSVDTAMVLISMGGADFDDWRVYDAIMSACSKGHKDMIEMLLGMDLDLDTVFETNMALRSAAVSGRADIVRMLLIDKRCKPNVETDYDDHLLPALIKSDKVGTNETLRIILKDGRVDPAADSNMAIRTASRVGNIDAVRILMDDERVDPSAEYDDALKSAIVETIARLLMRDERVDPESAIQSQILAGRIGIVRLLLSSDKTTFNFEEGAEMWLYELFHVACIDGHVEIARMLVEHDRYPVHLIRPGNLGDTLGEIAGSGDINAFYYVMSFMPDDRDLDRALSFAITARNTAIVDMILQHDGFAKRFDLDSAMETLDMVSGYHDTRAQSIAIRRLLLDAKRDVMMD